MNIHVTTDAYLCICNARMGDSFSEETDCITEQSPRLHESTWQEGEGARTTSAGGSGCSAGGPSILFLARIGEERKGHTLFRNDPTLEMTLPPNATNT